MAFDDEYGLLSDSNNWGAGGFFSPALSVGADQSYVTSRSEDSASGSAMDSMQTVRTPASDDAYGWLKDLAKTAVGYVISKDAQQNQVQPPQVYQATAAQARGEQLNRTKQNADGGILLLGMLVIGGVLLLKD